MYISIGKLDMRNYYIRCGMDDEQQNHRSVQSLFNGDRCEEEVLYRIVERGQDYVIYIQSKNKPSIEKGKKAGIIIEKIHDMSNIIDNLREGQVFRFNIVVVPARNKKVNENGSVTKRRTLRTQEERMDWLGEKLTNAGLNSLNTEKKWLFSEDRYKKVQFCHSENRGVMHAYEYSGVVKVENTESFLEMLKKGIGHGKAYGLGLFMIAPR